MQSWQYLRLNINDYLLKDGDEPMTGTLTVNKPNANDVSQNFILGVDGSANKLLINSSAQGGNYNPIVQSGDKTIIYNDGSFNTGNLVIAPLSNGAPSGIRMDNQGRVGIATATPTQTLDVSGTTLMTSNSSNSNTTFSTNTSQYQIFNAMSPPLPQFLFLTRVTDVSIQLPSLVNTETVMLNKVLYVSFSSPNLYLDGIGGINVNGSSSGRFPYNSSNGTTLRIVGGSSTGNYTVTQPYTFPSVGQLSQLTLRSNVGTQLNTEFTGIKFANTDVSAGFITTETNVLRNNSSMTFQVLNNNSLVSALTLSGNNVGVGITTPTQALDVNGSARIRSNLDVSGSTLMGNNLTLINDSANLTLSGSTPTFNLTQTGSRANIKGILDVSGATFLGSTLNVASNTTMGGTLNMSNNKITNLGIPNLPTDAVNKNYVDVTLNSTYVLKSGDTMTGPLTIINDASYNGILTLNTGSGSSNRTADQRFFSTFFSAPIADTQSRRSADITSGYNSTAYVGLGGGNGNWGSEYLTFNVGGNSSSNGQNLTTERVRITAAGNVGIGTPTPTQKLDVNGNINLTGRLALNGNIGSPGYTLKLDSSTGVPRWSVPDTYVSVYSIQNGSKDFLKTKSNQDFVVFSTNQFQVAGTSILSFVFTGTVGQLIYAGGNNDSANLYFRLISTNGVIINNSNSFYIDQNNRGNWVDKDVSHFNAPMVFSPYGGQLKLELYCNNRSDDNYAVRWNGIVINILIQSPDYIINNGTLNVTIT